MAVYFSIWFWCDDFNLKQKNTFIQFLIFKRNKEKKSCLPPIFTLRSPPIRPCGSLPHLFFLIIIILMIFKEIFWKNEFDHGFEKNKFPQKDDRFGLTLNKFIIIYRHLVRVCVYALCSFYPRFLISKLVHLIEMATRQLSKWWRAIKTRIEGVYMSHYHYHLKNTLKHSMKILHEWHFRSRFHGRGKRLSFYEIIVISQYVCVRLSWKAKVFF